MKGISEVRALEKLKKIMSKNKIVTSLIGKGYYNCNLPSPIRRHVLENPKWYTPYTPYQAEISQGRLETLYYFQKMIQEMTELPFSNASMLDQGSTSAEVISMSKGYHRNKRSTYLASETLHPYILDILETKCDVQNINLKIGNLNDFSIDSDTIGMMFQYPDTYGNICVPEKLIADANQNNSVVSCGTDLMALTKIKPPGELGVDIAYGTAQRFGIPLYYGGPHAAFLSCKEDFLRLIPGRIVGKTIDQTGEECFRLALQSREQHIRKDKAISNICTSQALLANMSSLYGIYYGAEGIQEIGNQIHEKTCKLKDILYFGNINIINEDFYDTLTIKSYYANYMYDDLKYLGYIAYYNHDEPNYISISIDETITDNDINDIGFCISKYITEKHNLILNENIPLKNYQRETPILKDPIFFKNWNETEFTRYIYELGKKDYSLCEGMIPLGSCTMKLNAAFQLEPMSWEEVGNMHPFLPKNYTEGYQELIKLVGEDLKKITGFNYVSFQSNSGATGEYTALLCIRKYHNNQRKICLIPESAHGTNFASASMAGMKIVSFDDQKFDNLDEFEELVSQYNEKLAVMMITYPNTNGVFQKDINKICDIIHKYGGLVYLDGANMNALAGKILLSEIGADVCHLNLHKTFCIPHGGGGPGMGPILCNDKLGKYLPTHRFQSWSEDSIGTITSSQWSSASLLCIPYLYFRNQEIDGIRSNTEQAIKNANYLKDNLNLYYNVHDNQVAHEFIIDLSEFKHINEVDVSKRLIDYSFHPPTMSWPKKGVIMIEPTESESKEELDRFIRALISIRNEIDNCPEIIKNAPHPISLLYNEWKFDYSINDAFFPLPELKKKKFWPITTRVNDIYGDKLMYKK
jgi:glycine dehydrogenase